MKLFDYIALGAALILTVLSFISSLSAESDSLEVVIESEGKEWIYPIDSIIRQTFTGPVGETVLVIGDGTVYIEKSDCREQICVQSGYIGKQGQWLACLPNRLFVSIRGKKESELDGEAY